MLIRIFSGFFLFFLLAQTGFAQKTVDRSNYALLWEITGNGLTKPSYLFGTMHVKDKRVFTFPDSLLYKLAESEAFITEVRFDSIMGERFQLSLTGDTSNLLKKRMSSKAYQRMTKSLEAKGYNMDSLVVKEPSRIYDLLTDLKEPPKKQGDKDLMLDQYLTRLAYWQGKTLGGLEQASDYIPIENHFFSGFESEDDFDQKWETLSPEEQEKMSRESLVTIYERGNLEEIASYYTIRNKLDSVDNRLMLDDRNIGMVEVLKSMIRKQSAFCAVGAAHLPGENGMLELLRKAGFTLRKVSPDFTGKKFELNKVEKPSYTYKSISNKIEMEFPDMYSELNHLFLRESSLGNTAYMFDLDNGSFYMASSSLHSDELTSTTFYALFDNMNKRMRMESMQVDTAHANGILELKFSGTIKPGGKLLGRYIANGRHLHFIGIIFEDENDKETQRTKKFLNSFKPLVDEETGMRRHDCTGSFLSFLSPGTPDKFERTIAESGEYMRVYQHSAVGQHDGKEMYLFRDLQLSAAQHFNDDSLVLSLFQDKMKESMGEGLNYIQDSIYVRSKGVCDLIQIGKTKANEFIAFRIFTRGQRFYTLYTGADTTGEDALERALSWFDSVQLSPLVLPEFEVRRLDSFMLSAQLPKQSALATSFREETTDWPFTREYSYAQAETGTAVRYNIIQSEFSPYFQQDSLSQRLYLTRDIISKNTETPDSVLFEFITFQGSPALRITHDNYLSNTIVERLIVLHDNKEYEIVVYLPREVAASGWEEAFFQSIKLDKPSSGFDMLAPKDALLQRDLLDADLSDHAKKALTETVWKKEQLPFLKTLFYQDYPNDVESYYSTKDRIIDAISQIKDSASVTYLTEIASNQELDESHRHTAMKKLFDGDTMYPDLFFSLYDYRADTSERCVYAMQRFMIDSLERANTYFGKYLAAHQEPYKHATVLYTLAALAKDDTLGILNTQWQKHEQAILRNGQAVVTELLRVKDELGYAPTDLMRAYHRFIRMRPLTEASETFLKMAEDIKEPNTLATNLHSQIKHGTKPKAASFKALKKTPLQYYYLMSALNDEQLLSKLHKHKIDADVLAHGLAKNLLTEEDYFEALDLKRVALKQEKDRALYVFQYAYEVEENERSYQCIGLILPTQGNLLDLEEEFVHYSEQSSQKPNTDEQIKELVEWYKTKATEKE